ncbi:MAG: hemerythrin family protein [Candidatus Omnitrophica bacterium]|nr:hemerythrin family protein [Candidatus Omnitrophota bacterium]
MSGIIEWDERFSVGIEEIDNQHKKLFAIIDSMFDGIAEQDNKEMLRVAFDKVLDYTRYHFATEESYFEKFNYPDAEEHKKQHAKLIEETLELQKEYCEGAPGMTLELIDFLTHWLQQHILLHDKKYAPFVNHPLKSGKG